MTIQVVDGPNITGDRGWIPLLPSAMTDWTSHITWEPLDAPK